MSIKILRPLLMIVCLATPAAAVAETPSEALGLVEIVELAESHDSAWLAAYKQREAKREAYPVARSAFFPQLQGSIGFEYRWENNKPLRRAATETKHNNAYARLQLSQLILDLSRVAQLNIAAKSVTVAEVEFQNAHQDLLLRATDAYFELSLAQEYLTLTVSQLKAISAQMEQAEKLQQGGVATKTDVFEAQARLDRAKAENISAQNRLDIARRNIRMLTGRSINAVKPLQRDLTFPPPSPANLEQWAKEAKDNSLDVKVHRLRLAQARQVVKRARSQHFPTIQGYINVDRNSHADTSLRREINGQVGIQLSVPLLSGGRLSAQSREALANLGLAEEEWQYACRQAELRASIAFSKVSNSLVEIHALEQAVKSGETALHAAEMSFKVAYRTFIDVLNAQQLLFRSQFDLLRARFDYIKAVVELNAAVGALDQDVIALIHGWQIQ